MTDPAPGGGEAASPFDPAPAGGTLGRKGIRASFHVLSFSLLRFGIQFGSLVALARLLSPADYGLMGMILTATGFAALFRDMGLSAATIEKPGLVHEDVNDAFWINAAAGVGLAALVALCAAPIAAFYGESRLTSALPVVGLTFIASGMSVQHSAVLRRQLRFFRIGLVDTLAALAAFLTSLALALGGAGYWALVAGPLVTEGLTCTLLWTFSRWRPTRPGRFSRSGRLLRVGAHMLGFNLLSYFSSALDRILVGRFLGADTLGVYTRAGTVVSLPTQQLVTPIAAVMLPMFSRLREHPDRYRTVILSGLRLMAAVTAPAVALLIVCNDWIVALLLGPKWRAAAAVIPALAVIGATQFIPNNLGWVLVAANRFRQLLVWNAAHLAGVAAAVAWGLSHGLVGVAAAYAAAVTVLRVPVLFRLVGASSPARTGALWGVCVPFWGMAAAAGGTVVLLRRWTGDPGPWGGLAMACAAMAAVYGGMILATGPGRDLIRDLRRVIRDLGPAKPAAATPEMTA